jgi:hypothetical protein
MTHGQDGWPDQYPQPDYGQRYHQENQPWPPPHDPRQQQYGTRGPQEPPWQQAQYPPQDYPPPGQWPPRQPPHDYGQFPQQPRQDYGQFQPPPRQRKRSRAPLYAGIAAVVVIAGGGTAYALVGHGGTPHTASLSSPSMSARAVAPATLSQLKQIVLRSADLPRGWKGTPHQADSSTPGEDAAMYKCLGVRNTEGDKVAEADSNDFSLGSETISSSASSYRSQSDLDADVAMLHNPKVPTCLGQELTKELATTLPAGATIQSTSIKITPGSAGGPANVVATGTVAIKVEANGQEIPLYMTIAFITGPLIEAEVDAVNLGTTPVPESVVKPLVATAATRASKG